MSRRNPDRDVTRAALDELLGIAHYEHAGPGTCDDCGRAVECLYVVGRVDVCAACCRLRVLAAGMVERREHDPPA